MSGWKSIAKAQVAQYNQTKERKEQDLKKERTAWQQHYQRASELIKAGATEGRDGFVAEMSDIPVKVPP